jgi:hypothetical protein
MGKLVRMGHNLPPKEIEEIARELNEMCRSTTLDLSFRIGKLVIEKIYGSVEVWASEGTRRASYRQLAARGDLLPSPSTLCRAVGVYVLALRLGGHTRFRHLGTSHFQELLPLEQGEQERLARIAETERWTVARVREEVIRRRPRSKQRAQAPQRVSARLTALIAKEATCVAHLQNLVLDAETTACLREALECLKRHVQELEAKLAESDEPPASGNKFAAVLDGVGEARCLDS